jgi:translation initiation factor 2 gamma subunit (eIF-2gamma)
MGHLRSHISDKHEMTVAEYCEEYDVEDPARLTGGVTEGELIDEIQRLVDEVRMRPTTRTMQEYGKYSTRPYYDHFGSWKNALREAGLDT